jgi:hypothetical protein
MRNLLKSMKLLVYSVNNHHVLVMINVRSKKNFIQYYWLFLALTSLSRSSYPRQTDWSNVNYGSRPSYQRQESNW